MTIAASDVLTLLAAIPLAAIGGASFLNGMLGIAAKLRLPNVLVATTLAAFATSSPELAVSSLAALAAAIHPITVPRAAVGVALAFGMLTVLLVMPRGGAIGRRQGLALLAAYGSFVYLTTTGALPGN